MGASLHELASCCSEAAAHRFLRGDGQLNTSAAMQSKARVHRIYGLPGLYTKQIMFYTYMYLHTYVWFALLSLLRCKKKKASVASKHKGSLELEPLWNVTTLGACAHASGASGGSDVRIDTYIRTYIHTYIHTYIDVQTESKLYR